MTYDQLNAFTAKQERGTEIELTRDEWNSVVRDLRILQHVNLDQQRLSFVMNGCTIKRV